MSAPRVAVVVFPGTWSDRDFLDVAPVVGWEVRRVWHAEHELPAVDAVVLPGGFAHGDYLRTGAIARFSPVMDGVADKLARIAWSVLRNGKTFDSHLEAAAI